MITMSRRETKRLHIIHQALDKRITQKTAAELVGLSSRQLRRMLKRVREDGDDGIAIVPAARVRIVASPKRSKRKHLSCLGRSTVISALPLPARSFLMFMQSK